MGQAVFILRFFLRILFYFIFLFFLYNPCAPETTPPRQVILFLFHSNRRSFSILLFFLSLFLSLDRTTLSTCACSLVTCVRAHQQDRLEAKSQSKSRTRKSMRDVPQPVSFSLALLLDVPGFAWTQRATARSCSLGIRKKTWKKMTTTRTLHTRSWRCKAEKNFSIKPFDCRSVDILRTSVIYIYL